LAASADPTPRREASGKMPVAARAAWGGNRCLSAFSWSSTDLLHNIPDHDDPAEYAKRGTVFTGRGKETIQRMFNDTKLVDPGVVLFSDRRPDRGHLDHNADQVWGYGGVARV
jgi:S-adenosyl methyltransferase